jgi:D-alanyl-D-alanine carboxypeptidase/D-alanyl-D-alanine-endopeptidase (penicillin-binding protein 4)
MLSVCHLQADSKELPQEMVQIMRKPIYEHATWGLFAKNGVTGEILYELNADKMFIPGSTTKLFTISALYKAYGEEYQFKTPVFATAPSLNGSINGNLILVGQGDLTFGGRQNEANQITFTKMDHIYANYLPDASITLQDPLKGLKGLAEQIKEQGIKEINGDVLIDDRLFETTEKRGMILSPIMVNENLIDIIINPSVPDQVANINWRPQVNGYLVKNDVQTVAKEGSLAIEVSSDETGKNILVKGTIPVGTKDILRTFSIKDPKDFARSAFIQALREQGIAINLPKEVQAYLPQQTAYKELKVIAEWVSPPLTEYVKLILKVSHNLGADLIPLLLAIKNGDRTFDKGMIDLGNFVVNEVKLPANAFVFVDAAGGDGNRLTPKGQVQLLDYIREAYLKKFSIFFDALPILGIDGSLADLGKESLAKGKIRAKTGTGVSYNLATQHYFLSCQFMTGYIVGKNNQIFEYCLGVNNAQMPEIKDIFPILEDLSQISTILYETTGNSSNLQH